MVVSDVLVVLYSILEATTADLMFDVLGDYFVWNVVGEVLFRLVNICIYDSGDYIDIFAVSFFFFKDLEELEFDHLYTEEFLVFITLGEQLYLFAHTNHDFGDYCLGAVLSTVFVLLSTVIGFIAVGGINTNPENLFAEVLSFHVGVAEIFLQSVELSGFLFLGGFLPELVGAPTMYIVVFLECFSYVAAQLTQTIRLFASNLAGFTMTHVLLGLIYSPALFASCSLFFVFFYLILLIILEGLVACVQAYVATILGFSPQMME